MSVLLDEEERDAARVAWTEYPTKESQRGPQRGNGTMRRARKSTRPTLPSEVTAWLAGEKKKYDRAMRDLERPGSINPISEATANGQSTTYAKVPSKLQFGN